ncbi:ABC transporter permease [Pseudomonas stutzeri]|nr:ABC transporter permease [Stutzerimonas stutzeri]
MLLPADSISGIRLAIRARFLWLSVGVLLILILASWMAGQFSGRQPATVALDVGFSVLRLLLPLVLVLMTQELLSREFDRRYFLSSLTYPRPRHGLLLGRFAAVLVLVFALLLAAALALVATVALIAKGYQQATPVSLGAPYVLSMAFFGLDLLVLAALAAFLAIVASTPSFVLIGTLGFMLVARSFAAIVELLTREVTLVSDAETYRSGLGVLGYLLPDLGALDVRMLALYGQWQFLPADWPWLVLSSLAYAGGFLALAIWALQRKRFV